MLCFLIRADSGLVYMVKRTGPKTEPWGTPYLRGRLYASMPK